MDSVEGNVESSVESNVEGSVVNPAEKNVVVRVRNSAVDFVNAWNSSNSAAEAAEKLRIGEMSATSRASTLRKAGVIGLKKMPRKKNGGRKKLDIAALNEYIAANGFDN